MAEGILRHLYGNRFEVFSAGTSPSQVNPYAIKSITEIGIDISHQRSKDVREFQVQQLDWVITVCDQLKERCPFLPGASRYLHWSFDDPSQIEGDDEQKMAAFRRVRDEIKKKIEETFGPRCRNPM
jgi:arsenate reductase